MPRALEQETNKGVQPSYELLPVLWTGTILEMSQSSGFQYFAPFPSSPRLHFWGDCTILFLGLFYSSSLSSSVLSSGSDNNIWILGSLPPQSAGSTSESWGSFSIAPHISTNGCYRGVSPHYSSFSKGMAESPVFLLQYEITTQLENKI